MTLIGDSRKGLNDYARSLFNDLYSGLGDRLTAPLNYRDGLLGLLFGCIALSPGCSGGIEYVYIRTHDVGQQQNENEIAFCSTRDGDWEIYSMDISGNNQKRLTNNNFADVCPSWSPDGTEIAFYSVRDNYEIYIIGADGSNERNLQTTLLNTSSPNWSPDGTKIAFHGNMGGQNDIYVINVNGTGEQKLTDNPGHDCGPAWSPDGNKIVYNAEKDGLYVMDSTGNNKQKLVDLPGDSYPDWSSDGTKIAFLKGSICLINPDGTGYKELGGGGSPSWSPDGTKIVFGSGGINIMNSDGSDVQKLTYSPDYYPDWRRNIP